jgi:hypothetical protein
MRRRVLQTPSQTGLLCGRVNGFFERTHVLMANNGVLSGDVVLLSARLIVLSRGVGLRRCHVSWHSKLVHDSQASSFDVDR